jgi:hypothetical protein
VSREKVIVKAGSAELSEEEEIRNAQHKAEVEIKHRWAKIRTTHLRYKGEPGADVFRVTGKRQVLAEYKDARLDPAASIRDTVTNMLLLCRYLGIDWENTLRQAEIAAHNECTIEANAGVSS